MLLETHGKWMLDAPTLPVLAGDDLEAHLLIVLANKHVSTG